MILKRFSRGKPSQAPASIHTYYKQNWFIPVYAHMVNASVIVIYLILPL